MSTSSEQFGIVKLADASVVVVRNRFDAHRPADSRSTRVAGGRTAPRTPCTVGTRLPALGIDFPLFPDALENRDGNPPSPLCSASSNLLDLDPRLTFALELGGELRLGQVLECTRRSLSLEASMLAPLGEFRVTQDAFGDWTMGSTTRWNVYQDKENQQVRADAASWRDAV